MTKTRHTVADYAALPEGTRVQLIDGELIMSPAPTVPHQDIVLNLAVALRRYLGEQAIGKVIISPVDVYLQKHEAYQPDVVLVLTEHLARLTNSGIQGAPDFVAEVLSPSTGYYDLTHKKRVYEQGGVQEYWIIDPLERTVEVFVREGDAFVNHASLRETGTVVSVLLTGFEIDLDVLFA